MARPKEIVVSGCKRCDHRADLRRLMQCHLHDPRPPEALLARPPSAAADRRTHYYDEQLAPAPAAR